MESDMEQGLQIATFRLEGEWFGLDVQRIQEVTRPQAVTAVPLADAAIRGLMNVRGLIVTCLSLKHLLGFSRRDYDSSYHHIIVRDDHDDSMACLLVDEIGDVITVDPKRAADVPSTVDPHLRRFIDTVFRLDGQLISVLDLDHLLRMEDG
ncbi:MAG: chemotaxis protein CheW [Planctomycetota bacterium]